MLSQNARGGVIRTGGTGGAGRSHHSDMPFAWGSQTAPANAVRFIWQALSAEAVASGF
jgi:hypothetical protein